MNKLLLISVILFLAFVAVAEPVQVTVYNKNLALVKTEQEVGLEKGETQFVIRGVSAKIDPTSVHLKFDRDQDKVDILEMNFLYDLVNSSKIFKKYTDKEIVYHLEDGTQYSGKLLSYTGGDLIIEQADGGILITSTNQIRNYKFPELPGGLITVPTLRWTIDSRIAGVKKAELSYLTEGLSWHAEYVLVLAENDRDFSLSSWVSLENNSGASYPNANVKLIAGDIHRARDREAVPRQVMLSRAAAEKEVERREIFDYHLYELGRRVNIANKEIKQIALFDNVMAQADKKYIYENSAYNPSDESSMLVKLFINNTKDNDLGFPLPKGKVRMFKKDVDESLQLIGEDNISHISENDELELTAGKAFDVKGERSIVNREKYENEEIIEVKIILKNRTERTAAIEVRERHHGDWHVKSSNSDYHKKSNSLLVFPVNLKGKTEKTIEYEFVREF